jgi:hypothetical protein
MIKDINEIFKFLIFLMNFNLNIQPQREVIFKVSEMTREFITCLCKLDIEKSLFVLKYYFIDIVVANMTKAKDLSQFLLLKMIHYFVESNDLAMEETVRILFERVKEKEIVFKALDVFTHAVDFGTENGKETVRMIKEYLKETRLTNNNEQKAFFVKMMTNFLEIDLMFVQKLWKKYSDFFNERENDDLISVYLFFLSKFYSKCIEFESQSATMSDRNGAIKEKRTYNEAEFRKLKTTDKKKPSMFQSEKIIEKVQQLLAQASRKSLDVFFANYGLLIECNQKILEMYLNRLVECDLAKLDEYLSASVEFDIKEKIEDIVGSKDASSLLIHWSKMRYFWIGFENKEFSNQIFIRNGISIINYLLKMVNEGIKDNSKTEALWKILNFCFFNCRFEALNFEHFDFISNSIFNFILEELGKGNLSVNLTEVLKAILRFETRNELSLKHFERFFERVYSSMEIKIAVIELLSELYSEFKENEVYQNNFFMKFGPLKSEITQ